MIIIGVVRCQEQDRIGDVLHFGAPWCPAYWSPRRTSYASSMSMPSCFARPTTMPGAPSEAGPDGGRAMPFTLMSNSPSSNAHAAISPLSAYLAAT